MSVLIPPPAVDEYAEAFARYVRRVPEADPVEAMAREIESTLRLLASAGEEGASARYAPGKWSLRQVAGHLADVERVMAYRALRFARGDTTELPGFDENLYVDHAASDRRSLADLLDELRHVRASTLALFRGFDEAAWARRGIANGGPMSVRAIARIIPGHERHHGEGLRTNYGLRG